ncbi:MAG: SAM-dependent methyltransferase [Streptomyces sp.]|uniref:SAM-dependent methyltransferase n=1 Tax=Streptomyces sp. TaxID=1931 RepID=UPI003D6A3BFD
MTGQGQAPEIDPGTARAHREFMIRATRWLTAERGMRQFLDIGSGIPAEPVLHRIARAAAPEAKVVYADSAPLVGQHARELLRGTPEGSTAYVHADVTDPESILDAPGLSDTIDLGRPVALCVNAHLPFAAPAEHPYEMVRSLLSALPAESYLALTHTTADFAVAARFFDGLEPAAPGLVAPHRWRPADGTPTGSGGSGTSGYAGVARKRR